MKGISSFRKFTPLLIKLFSAAAVTTVAGAIGDDGTLISNLLPSDREVVEPLFKTIASVSGSQTYDLFKGLTSQRDIGFKGDLQKTYQAALKLTFTNLQKRYLQENSHSNPKFIESFFENISADYFQVQEDIAGESAHKILEAYNSKESFFIHVTEIMQLEASSPEGKLLYFLIDNFPTELACVFHEQLLAPQHEVARIGFMIYIGEQSLSISKNNAETLEKFNKLLGSIANNQQHEQQLQSEIARVQRQIWYKLKNIEDGIHTIVQQTESKLPLSLPQINVDNERRHLFQYKAAYTTFIGREAEIRQLDEFVRVDDEPFRWLLVAGPGGVGKSRLALEYCEKLRKQGLKPGAWRTLLY